MGRGAGTNLRALRRRAEAWIWAYAQRRSGHIILVLLASAAWAAIWAGFDIAVVRWAFPPPLNPASSTQLYWYATWGFVFPLTTMLAFREHAWLPILAVLAGAWEDLLFYWLLGVFVIGGPGWTFYVRGAIFLPLAILGEIASHRWSVRRNLVALAALLAVAAYINLVSTGLLIAAIVVYLASVRLAEILRASGRVWSTHPRGWR